MPVEDWVVFLRNFEVHLQPAEEGRRDPVHACIFGELEEGDVRLLVVMPLFALLLVRTFPQS